MSQAENSTTTNCAPAWTPAALPPVKVAHAALVGVLLRLKPHRIIGTEWADHLEKVLAAVTVYAKAIVADTARMAPCGYIHDETGLLADAASDVVSALKNAVDRMLDDAAE